MKFPFLVAAFMAGAILPLQTLINGRLAGFYGSAVLAAATSFQIGAAVLFAYHLLSRSPANDFRFSDAPVWLWLGGLMGTIYMVGVTASVSKLGAASMVSLVILGQICAALLLDHFGVLAQFSHPVSLFQLMGAVLVFAGVWMVTHF